MSVGVEGLFTSALGLVAPWEVAKVELDTVRRRIDFEVRCSAKLLACPRCGVAAQTIHDRLRRSSRNTVMSMSSEKRGMRSKAFESDVPPLKSRRGLPASRPLNKASSVQHTQKSFSTFCTAVPSRAAVSTNNAPLSASLDAITSS
jgi:hypothetical protein